MHAVIRNYSGKGAKELFDVVEKSQASIEKVMRPVKGFASYSAARTDDGGFTITVCQDKAGCDESVRAAREWVTKNAGNTGASAPTISEGTVMWHLK